MPRKETGPLQGSYDVLIVGGAVMGSSIAYFLLANPDFNGRVLVVERDPSYGRTATTRSWGGMRQQFSVRENVEMSLFGLDFIKTAPTLLTVDDEVPDFQFHDNGYLFLATAEGLPTLESNVALQQSLGAAVDLMTAAELGERFPWLALDDLAGGAYGGKREGWIDPYALLQAFKKKARALGAHYVHDEVVAIHREGNRVVAAELKDHGRVWRHWPASSCRCGRASA